MARSWLRGGLMAEWSPYEKRGPKPRHPPPERPVPRKRRRRESGLVVPSAPELSVAWVVSERSWGELEAQRRMREEVLMFRERLMVVPS